MEERSRSWGLPHGSKHRSEIRDGRVKRGKDRSASPGKGSVAEKHRSDKCRYIHVEHEQEGKSTRDPKRVRYSNREEQRKYSPDGLSEKHKISSAYPDWGDRTNVNDAAKPCRPSTTKRGSNVETNNKSVWQRLSNKTTSQNAPGSSQQKSDINKWVQMEINNSSTRSNWDYEKTTRNAPVSSQRRSDTDKWGSNVETNNSSAWDKWPDKTTSQNAPGSSKRRSDTDKWGANLVTNYNPTLPKPEDTTTTQNAPGSSQRKSDTDKWGSNVKTNNNSALPKWDDKVTTRNLPVSSQRRLDTHKWGPIVETNDGLSWDKWPDKTTTQKAPGSSLRKSDEDKWGSNVETNNSSALSKWGDKTSTRNAAVSIQQRKDTDKWSSNVKTNNSTTWDKWDQTTNQKAPGSSQQRSDTEKWGTNVETNNSSAWPKWNDKKTTQITALSSERRADTDKWGSNLETNKSSAWPKWGDETTTRNAAVSIQQRKDTDKWNSNVKTNNSTTWDKWDQTTNQKAPGSSQRRSDRDKWGSNVETNNSSAWPKWDDKKTTQITALSSQRRADTDKWGSNMETNKSSAWPKWDDKMAEDAPGSSQRRSDMDVWGSNVENSSSSWNGSKWGSKTTTEDAHASVRWKEHADKRLASDVESGNGLSSNGPRWGDKETTKTTSDSSKWMSADDEQCQYKKMLKDLRYDKWDTSKSLRRYDSYKLGDQIDHRDVPNHSQKREDGDMKECDTKASNSKCGHHSTGKIGKSSWNDPKQGNRIISEAATNFPVLKPNDRKNCSMKAEDILSKNVLKSSDRTIAKDAPKCVDAEEELHVAKGTDFISSLNDPKCAYQITTADSSKSPWKPDCKQNVKGKESSNNQNHLPPPHVTQMQKLGHSIPTSGMGTTGQPPSNGQGMRVEGHSNQESGTGEKSKDNSKEILMLMFKSAIAEFAKDILKPFWKDGCLTREAHKIIVKKTVDKVVVTLQGYHIPRTPADIDQYLSVSKTRLTTLVLAYFEIFGKV